MVDLVELQSSAVRVAEGYVEKFGITRDAAWYLGKRTEELGELNAARLKLNQRARHEGNRQAMEDEAADLLGFLRLFADWQGIDLSVAFVRKWEPFDPAGSAL